MYGSRYLTLMTLVWYQYSFRKAGACKSVRNEKQNLNFKVSESIQKCLFLDHSTWFESWNNCNNR